MKCNSFLLNKIVDAVFICSKTKMKGQHYVSLLLTVLTTVNGGLLDRGGLLGGILGHVVGR